MTYPKRPVGFRLCLQLDVAEDVFTGIEMATQMNWSSTLRIIIHAGDAPQHGADFHDLGQRGWVLDQESGSWK